MDRNRLEILAPTRTYVALRKESVDRNTFNGRIDMTMDNVALRKESVDRNVRVGVRDADISSRSPQGERG